MFGFVTANRKELTKQQMERYSSIYCGICLRIRQQASQVARLGLSYDMAFLALLLMSLYEPEEESARLRCGVHPFRRCRQTDSEFIRYAADMNVALAYYNFLDDWNDEGKRTARWMAGMLEADVEKIKARYPRQCGVMETCLGELSRLEKAGCANPDEPAHVFGRLLAELLVYREDLWESSLRQMGDGLGRFIYLADAAVDYRKDRRRGKYNPFGAQCPQEDWARWEQYLVLAMERCTKYYEMLPLVQDKALLDNILYSGVWTNFRMKGTEAREKE